MSDFQAIADRVEIEAPDEFTGTATMRGGDRFASLFTYDGVLRMPNIPAPGCPGRAFVPRLVGAPAPRRLTGSPAPSTTCSSSTPNPAPAGAPSCCSAKPPDSEPPRELT